MPHRTWRLPVTLVALIGLPMGIPFPSAIRLAGAGGRPAALLWAVNGAFSVLGSVLAVVISMGSGFGLAFTIGAGGEVREVRDAGGDLDDELVRTCVVRTFLGLSFPPPMGGGAQKAVLPIILRREPD